MANGRRGDHPLTDIILHGLRVYSERADRLIREIVHVGGREEIADMLRLRYNPFQNPDVAQLERALTVIRDRLFQEGEDQGWEV